MQLHTWNKCFYCTQSCSCSVLTIRATGNVISPVTYVWYFYIGTFSSLCAVPNMVDFVFP
jgi:hypothetical protein